MKNSAASSITVLLCSIALIAGGCRRPAYQDVYVQNMAAEIRELEDIIYEYDHEYRKLELELEAAQRENQLLRKMGITSKASSAAAADKNTPSPVDRSLPEITPRVDKLQEPSVKQTPDVPSSQKLNEQPAPSTPLKSLDSENASPLKLQPSPAPAIKEDKLPAPSPSILPPPIPGNGKSQGAEKSQDAGKKTENALDPGLMEPPAIDLGEPTDALPLDLNQGQPVESGKIKEGASPPAQLLPPPTLGALEVELGRIPTTSSARRKETTPSVVGGSPQNLASGAPVSQASFTQNSTSTKTSQRNDSTVPLDQRMTDIAFVRPFSIALDLDGQPGDDAVRLVLQPRNAAGEFLEQAAELTVSIIDPEIQNEAGRVGIWKYSAEEVSKSMRKQGTARGIHIDLSLDGKVAAGKKVMVFVRYQTPDGRRLENQYEYSLSSPGDLDSKWLPRAGSSSRNPRDSRG